MSAEPKTDAGQAAVRALRVEAVFHVRDEPQAETVAAKMVDRAHEIANLPECECDLDISVQRVESETAGERLSRRVSPLRERDSGI